MYALFLYSAISKRNTHIFGKTRPHNVENKGWHYDESTGTYIEIPCTYSSAANNVKMSDIWRPKQRITPEANKGWRKDPVTGEMIPIPCIPPFDRKPTTNKGWRQDPITGEMIPIPCILPFDRKPTVNKGWRKELYAF